MKVFTLITVFALSTTTLAMTELPVNEKTIPTSGKFIYHEYKEPFGVMTFTFDGDAAENIFNLLGRAPKAFESTGMTASPSGDFKLPTIKRMLLQDNWLNGANDTLICEKAANRYTCSQEVLVKYEKESALKKKISLSDLAGLTPINLKNTDYKSGSLNVTGNRDGDLVYFSLTYSGEIAKEMYELAAGYPDSYGKENAYTNLTGDINCSREVDDFICRTGPMRIDTLPPK